MRIVEEAAGPMKVPNAENAVIAPEKLRDYLMNPDHRRGGSKAKLLLSMGYQADQWQRLEMDLREQHLTAEVEEVEENDYGRCYAIVAGLTGPVARTILFRSIWQIDLGTDSPRLITMYPEKR
jgi:hypothetical protein